jgi:hypothetical protein
MTDFKTMLLNDDCTIAYYSKKPSKAYATLKCKIKKEYPSEEEIKIFKEAISDFYDNTIDKNLKYKIKFDIQNMGFIGFTAIYECGNCFRTEKSIIINENILINTTIFIGNSKLKFVLDSIFSLLTPIRPIIFKCTDSIKDQSLDNTEKSDINNTLTTLFDW